MTTKADVVLITSILICVAGATGYYIEHPQVRAEGYAEGRIQSIGQPMKYKDVPKGHYHVVAVVDKYQPCIAVIRRDTEATGYTTHESWQYLLVTDMMPNMMAENFSFTVGGTPQQ